MPAAYAIFAETETHPWGVAKIVGTECTIVAVPVEQTAEDASPPPPAKLLKETLRKLGHRREPVLLGLPSRLCLSASIDARGLRRVSREAALLFRLEEQLPLPLEEIVADFIQAEEHALGVAVLAKPVRALLDALEEQKISIGHICPTAVLAGSYLQGRWKAEAEFDAILLASSGGVDLLALRESKLCGWTLTAASAELIAPHLRHCAQNGESSPLRVQAIGLDATLVQELSQVSAIELPPPNSSSVWELAALAAGQISNGQPPLLELHRGKIGTPNPFQHVRVPAIAACVALILCSICLGAAMLWRASQYQRLSDAAQARQLIAFHQALPHQPAPPLIASRLRSELRRIKAGQTGDIAAPNVPSVLPLLHQTLAGLPRNLRYRLVELRFENGKLYLAGQSLDHAGADQIAQSLSATTGLTFDPPHTTQEAGADVEFVLSSAEPQRTTSSQTPAVSSATSSADLPEGAP